MFKKLLTIAIFILFLVTTMISALALDVKKEVIFETYNGSNEFQFYNDTIVSEITTNSENLTINQTILYSINTMGDFANFKIKYLGFPYKINQINSLEYFISTNGTTTINPNYPSYYIEKPTQPQQGGGGSYLSVISKEETKIFDADKYKVQFLLVFLTVLIGSFILLLERRKRRNRQQNTI
jgi:hypothetical protein